MSRRTVILLALAIAVSVANLMFLVAGYILPVSAVVLDGLGSLVLLVCFCIVTLPWALRATLIPAVLITFLAVAASTDILGLTRTKQDIEVQTELKAPPKVSGQSSPWSTLGAVPAVQHASSAQGACVQFRGINDVGRWAMRMNSEFDHQIGGDKANAISIRSAISSARAFEQRSIVMIWSIEFGGTSKPCGRSSIVGFDDDVLAEQARQTITRAVDRTIATHEPACY